MITWKDFTYEAVDVANCALMIWYGAKRQRKYNINHGEDE